MPRFPKVRSFAIRRSIRPAGGTTYAPGATPPPTPRARAAAFLRVLGTSLLLTACGEGVSNANGSPAPTVARVELSPRLSEVEVGRTVAFAAAARDQHGGTVTGRAVSWESSDAAVATIGESGVATGMAPGTVLIHGSIWGRTDSATLVVKAPGQPADVVVTINTSVRHPISRFIYGMNLTTDNGGAYRGLSPWYGANPPAEVTLDRMGGNRLSAYNWENNYSNAGNDYHFQNDDFLSQSRTPGEAVRTRVAAARGRGAATMVTVPMLGYVAADGNGPVDTRDATRATRLATRFKESVPVKGSPFTLTPDTRDARVYQDEFVHWVDRTFPGAIGDAAAPIVFSLDNEPDSWHATHKQVMSDSGDNSNRPRIQSYDGFINTTIAYASAIKAVAPNAMVFGPAVATYAGVLTMGRYPHADPKYGTQPFFDVYLARMRDAERDAGRRLLDALDLHWYPATGTNAGEITNDWAPQDAAMVRARVQAPRSLWDPTYDERSWVSGTTNGPIELLPRLRRQIAQHYPGTRIAITEYYYGRGGDISGGIAQADVLGIFGREGVHTAAFWPQAGVSAQPYGGSGEKAYAYVFGAFRMYLNYDGKGARFGDTGVAVTSSDTENASVYASLDAEGRVVIVLINKAATPKVVSLAVQHQAPLATAHPHTLTASSSTPVAGTPLTIGAGNTVRYTMPAMSVTTLQLRP